MMTENCITRAFRCMLFACIPRVGKSYSLRKKVYEKLVCSMSMNPQQKQKAIHLKTIFIAHTILATLFS